MKKSLKERMTLHPIMTILLLIFFTIILSGFLSLLDLQVTYDKINADMLEYTPETIAIKSLFSLRGLKYIFTSTISNFVAFTPLSSLIIILIGIGVMEKSGFLKTAITLLTKKVKKTNVTFTVVLISILSSLIGDLSFIIIIPLSALLYVYGKRNPNIGIVASFAGLTCGQGLSIFLTSIDSTMMTQTILGSHLLDINYTIGTFSFIIIMLVAIIILAFLITRITENYISKKLPKYEFPETALEEDLSIGRKELKGLLFGLGAGLLYLLIFIYNIIPGLPFSGNLLDYSQNFYIDKLFSFDSFFSNGFVFIVTILFVILGFFYGIGAKTIKNNKDLCDDLGHSLDGIGNTLVLIFFAATLINIFKYSNIGGIIVAALSNLIGSVNFSALPLIILLFIVAFISTILMPSSIARWGITAGIAIPVLMNAGISAEFAQIIYRFGESAAFGMTPLFAYFVIYLAYLEKYNQNRKPINLFKTIKYQAPYSFVTFIVLLILIIIWYLIGLPIGINAYPII